VAVIIWKDKERMKGDIEAIIGNDAKKLVKVAEKLGNRWGRELGSKKSGGIERNDERLTTSQIRSVFGNIKKIEMKGFEKQKREFLLLKPKLAYTASRSGKKKGIQELRDVLTIAIDFVERDEDFSNFCDFFEAILAYHRAAGGK